MFVFLFLPRFRVSRFKPIVVTVFLPTGVHAYFCESSCSRNCFMVS